MSKEDKDIEGVDSYKECSQCNGKGYILMSIIVGDKVIDNQRRTCTNCNGSGMVLEWR